MDFSNTALEILKIEGSVQNWRLMMVASLLSLPISALRTLHEICMTYILCIYVWCGIWSTAYMSLCTG